MVDGNVYGEDTDEARRLLSMEKDQWIGLHASFQVLNEVSDTPNDERRDELLAEADGRLVALDAAFAGPETFPGQVVAAGEADEERVRRIWEVVKPNVVNRNAHAADVVILNTAIRYAMDGLVTRDRQMIAKDSAVREAFNGFMVLSPGDCVALVDRRIRRYGIQNPETSNAGGSEPPGNNND